MKKFNKILFTVLFTIIGFSVFSQEKINRAPANSKPIEFKQPDGTVVNLILKGDERIHWAESMDGFTLLSNDKGFYEYAKLDKDKNLVCSGIIAKDIEKRTCKEKRFLKKTQKGIHFNDNQINEKLKRKE